jgi:glycosyltransferase involved in cell wall biosynthesis
MVCGRRARAARAGAPRGVNLPTVLVLGPHREAVSGVSTHVNTLLASGLAQDFSLIHFQVGGEGRRENRARRLVRLAASPFRLAAAILARGAAIVHINSSLNARAYWRDLVYLLVAKACGARVLFQVHGGKLPQEFCGNNRLLAALLHRTLLLPDAIVVLASVELEAYRRFVHREQILALPNAIDCLPYDSFLRERPDPAGALRLTYVGRLARQKGLYELLAGLQLARAAGVRARLVIAGAGPEEEKLRHLVAAAGIGHAVTFAGPVCGAGKSALFAQSDLFVLPSHAEGLPYALLESMAAGVPAIVTRVGGIPDVVLEGIHGLFVPLHDPQAIAHAIATLDADRALLAQMGIACRKRIAASYSVERLAGDVRRLYADMFAGKRADALP